VPERFFSLNFGKFSQISQFSDIKLRDTPDFFGNLLFSVLSKAYPNCIFLYLSIRKAAAFSATALSWVLSFIT